MARFGISRGWLAGASILSLGLALGVAAPASAQQASAGPGANANATTSADASAEEVVVTAQRREQQLQDVPLAVDAFSSKQIENNDIHGLDDITGRSAGVIFRPLNVAMPSIYIRGIGSTQTDNTSDQSTGVFQDEVYLARTSALSSELFDVQRIEVLKGPQGTLYGRNTIGGAINIISQAPTDDLQGYLGASYGEFNSIATRGAISGPIAPGILGRLAFVTHQHDGYSHNTTTGLDTNDQDTQAIRGRLRLEPSDRLTVDLTLDGTRDRGGAYEAKSLGRQSFLGIVTVNPIELTDAHTTVQNFNGYQNRDLWGFTGRADYHLNDALTLTSLSAYRHSASHMARDMDNTQIDKLFAIEDEVGHQVSQEFRVAYDGGGAFRAITGLYYFTESSERSDAWHVRESDHLAFSGTYTWDVNATNTSYAAFGQLDADLLHNLTLTLGLRYSHDKKSADYNVFSNATTANVGIIRDNDPSDPDQNYFTTVDHSWQSLDPSVTLTWHATPNAMLYASYREGFKSGGFQQRPLSPAVVALPFDPETLHATEVGARTDWLSGTFRANISAFHYDYRNLQVINVVPPNATITDNIGVATINGAEVELTAHPSPALTVAATLTFTDAVMDEYLDSSGNNFSGNRLPRSPKTAFNLSTDYNLPTWSWGQVSAHAEYNWRDEMFFLVNNNPVDHADALGIFNARLTLTTPNGRYKVAVFGNNLTDEEYCANYSPGAPQSTNGFCAVGAPREVGVSVLYNFD